MEVCRLKVLGSSSSGNCYIIECCEESLILELGLPFKEIIKGIEYDLKKVRACLVSHHHL